MAIETGDYYKMNETILIVDDSEDTIVMLKKKLTEFNVLSAKNGKEMWNSLKKEVPSLVLLDVIMPDDDGFEIARQLSRIEEYSNIPIVFITAKTDGKDVELGFNSGGFDYIKKPIDITELKVRVKSAIKKKKVEKDLKYLSLTDPLTGIYNRRYFFDILLKQVEYKKRNSDISFSLAIIDIDYFKSINDNYGHLAGDHVLIEFVEIIKKNIRPYDLLARYGGEEFVLFFFDCPKEESYHILERIRENLANTIFNFKKDEKTFTFSCGVAEIDEIMGMERVAEELIRLADDRLYLAKGAGRNKIVMQG